MVATLRWHDSLQRKNKRRGTLHGSKLTGTGTEQCRDRTPMPVLHRRMQRRCAVAHFHVAIGVVAVPAARGCGTWKHHISPEHSLWHHKVRVGATGNEGVNDVCVPSLCRKVPGRPPHGGNAT